MVIILKGIKMISSSPLQCANDDVIVARPPTWADIVAGPIRSFQEAASPSPPLDEVAAMTTALFTTLSPQAPVQPSSTSTSSISGDSGYSYSDQLFQHPPPPVFPVLSNWSGHLSQYQSIISEAAKILSSIEFMHNAWESLQVSHLLLSRPAFSASASFHAGEACEKSLKALIAVKAGPSQVPKIHDLRKLADLAFAKVNESDMRFWSLACQMDAWAPPGQMLSTTSRYASHNGEFVWFWTSPSVVYRPEVARILAGNAVMVYNYIFDLLYQYFREYFFSGRYFLEGLLNLETNGIKYNSCHHCFAFQRFVGLNT